MQIYRECSTCIIFIYNFYIQFNNKNINNIERHQTMKTQQEISPEKSNISEIKKQTSSEIRKQKISYYQRVIQAELYKKAQFFENQKQMRLLINYLCNLKLVPDIFETHITQLIKFYGFPILIVFKNIYKKISELKSQEKNQYLPQIQYIASFVQCSFKELEIKQIDELSFYFQFQVGKKKFKIPSKSKEEKQFAQYIVNLSQSLKVLKSKAQKPDKNNNFGQIKKLQTQFLEAKLSKSYNYLEQNFQNHIKNEAMDLISKMQQYEQASQISSEINSSLVHEQEEEISFVNDYSSKLKSQDQEKNKEKDKSANKSNKNPFQNCSNVKNIPLCCRQYFISDEIIEQPESLRIQYKYYSFPFYDKKDQIPSKKQKIKRTICGFLNCEGGIIYFGVKEDKITKKRTAGGFCASQSKKIQFNKCLNQLLGDVKPQEKVMNKMEIKYVPLKNRKEQNYISGMYIAKVIIQQGDADAVYSYIHAKQQKFTFKTQNEVIQIFDPQRILNIFKQKLTNPQKKACILHEGECLKPQTGRPIYSDSSFNNEYEYEQDESCISVLNSSEFPSIEENSREEKEKQREKMKKKYKEKSCLDYLLEGINEEDLKEVLLKQDKFVRKAGIEITSIGADQTLIHIGSQDYMKELKEIVPNSVKINKVYLRIKILKNFEDKSILLDIIETLKKELKIISSREDDVLVLKNAKDSVLFYNKLKEMEIDAEFWEFA